MNRLRTLEAVLAHVHGESVGPALVPESALDTLAAMPPDELRSALVREGVDPSGALAALHAPIDARGPAGHVVPARPSLNDMAFNDMAFNDMGRDQVAAVLANAGVDTAAYLDSARALIAHHRNPERSESQGRDGGKFQGRPGGKFQGRARVAGPAGAHGSGQRTRAIRRERWLGGAVASFAVAFIAGSMLLQQYWPAPPAGSEAQDVAAFDAPRSDLAALPSGEAASPPSAAQGSAGPLRAAPADVPASVRPEAAARPEDNAGQRNSGPVTQAPPVAADAGAPTRTSEARERSRALVRPLLQTTAASRAPQPSGVDARFTVLRGRVGQSLGAALSEHLPAGQARAVAALLEAHAGGASFGPDAAYELTLAPRPAEAKASPAPSRTSAQAIEPAPPGQQRLNRAQAPSANGEQPRASALEAAPAVASAGIGEQRDEPVAERVVAERMFGPASPESRLVLRLIVRDGDAIYRLGEDALRSQVDVR